MKTQTEGRSTVYNEITTDDKLKQVHKENKELEEDFLDYLASTNKSKGTIKQYRANLHIFWCWNLEYNENKRFTKLTKRELVRFQKHALDEWGWSPRRMRTVRATISSLSKYIENILDDEYEDYKAIIGKIEPPPDSEARTKTVFKEDELKALLDYLVEKEEYMKACALSLAINSGRRKAELPRFKIGYFRPEFTICSGALYKTPEMVQTKGRGEDGKPLYLYTLTAPFNPYLDLWVKKRERLGVVSEWLFPKRRGGQWLDEPIEISTLDSWARSFSKWLGKPFYWHSIRHFFTTKLVSYGIPATVIQDVVGRESADMVNRYDDTEKDDRFEKYFGAEGIRKVEAKSLEQL